MNHLMTKTAAVLAVIMMAGCSVVIASSSSDAASDGTGENYYWAEGTFADDSALVHQLAKSCRYYSVYHDAGSATDDDLAAMYILSLLQFTADASAYDAKVTVRDDSFVLALSKAVDGQEDVGMTGYAVTRYTMDIDIDVKYTRDSTVNIVNGMYGDVSSVKMKQGDEFVISTSFTSLEVYKVDYGYAAHQDGGYVVDSNERQFTVSMLLDGGIVPVSGDHLKEMTFYSDMAYATVSDSVPSVDPAAVAAGEPIEWACDEQFRYDVAHNVITQTVDGVAYSIEGEDGDNDYSYNDENTVYTSEKISEFLPYRIFNCEDQAEFDSLVKGMDTGRGAGGFMEAVEDAVLADSRAGAYFVADDGKGNEAVLAVQGSYDSLYRTVFAACGLATSCFDVDESKTVVDVDRFVKAYVRSMDSERSGTDSVTESSFDISLTATVTGDYTNEDVLGSSYSNSGMLTGADREVVSAEGDTVTISGHFTVRQTTVADDSGVYGDEVFIQYEDQKWDNTLLITVDDVSFTYRHGDSVIHAELDGVMEVHSMLTMANTYVSDEPNDGFISDLCRGYVVSSDMFAKTCCGNVLLKGASSSYEASYNVPGDSGNYPFYTNSSGSIYSVLIPAYTSGCESEISECGILCQDYEGAMDIINSPYCGSEDGDGVSYLAAFLLVAAIIAVGAVFLADRKH